MKYNLLAGQVKATLNPDGVSGALHGRPINRHSPFQRVCISLSDGIHPQVDDDSTQVDGDMSRTFNIFFPRDSGEFSPVVETARL